MAKKRKVTAKQGGAQPEDAVAAAASAAQRSETTRLTKLSARAVPPPEGGKRQSPTTPPSRPDSSPPKSDVSRDAVPSTENKADSATTSRKRAAGPSRPGERPQPHRDAASPEAVEQAPEERPAAPKPRSGRSQAAKTKATKRTAMQAPDKAEDSDPAAQEVEQPAKRARATKRAPAATAEVGAGPSSPPQSGAQSPPSVRAADSKSSDGAPEKASAVVSKPKRAARAKAAPNVAGTDAATATASGSQGPSADKGDKGTLEANPELPAPPAARGQGPTSARKAGGKELPSEGSLDAAPQGTGQSAAKARPARKRAQKKQKGSEDEVSNASQGSDEVPRGLQQRARRKARSFDLILSPLEEEDSEEVRAASVSGLASPAGLPQSPKRRRAEGGADYDPEVAVSPGEDLLCRCAALFGEGALPNSTTTTAEAVNMLVAFASSRRLQWGALAELVAIVNKLFAPAKDVLPEGKILASLLSQVP